MVTGGDELKSRFEMVFVGQEQKDMAVNQKQRKEKE